MKQTKRFCRVQGTSLSSDSSEYEWPLLLCTLTGKNIDKSTNFIILQVGWDCQSSIAECIPISKSIYQLSSQQHAVNMLLGGSNSTFLVLIVVFRQKSTYQFYLALFALMQWYSMTSRKIETPKMFEKTASWMSVIIFRCAEIHVRIGY